MQETLKMKDSIKEETSSDKFTPDVPERIGSNKGNGKGKTNSDTPTGKGSANDVHEDEVYTEDTTKVEKSESDEVPETKGGVVAIFAQPAKDGSCNVPDMKSGPEHR